jgi:cellulose synthase operon protein C
MIVTAVSAAFVTSALAQEERRSRRYEDVSSGLGERQERDLDDALKEDLTHEPVEREEARPTLDFEQFRRTVELQVASKRRSQIDTLSRIVNMGPSPEEAPDLLFRLAELYWEEARYYFFEANAKDDEIIQARQRRDDRRVRALQAEKEALEGQSEHYRLQSIERYREIVRDYPEYERLDQVLFSLGSNLWERDQADEALRVYGVLVQRFPDSEYVPDAYLSVAEHHFREGNVRVAQRGYERAVEFTDSRVYGYALYKLGWTHYNLGDFSQAGDLWRSVVYYGELATEIGGESKMALVREARRDFVLAYSHYGDPRTAMDVFKELGGDEHWPRMLRSLANLYYDDGKNREAIIVYRQLIDLDELSPEAPLFQARIVDAGQRLGNKRFTVNQARVLVDTFEAVREGGRVQTDEDRKLLSDAETISERTLRTLAVTWHSEARKTRSEETYWFAYEMYKDYVSLFPHSSFEYQIRFYFAELLFYLEKWAEAAEQYTATVNIDAERMEGKRRDAEGNVEEVGEFMADAAFNAVLALEEVVSEFDGTEELPEVEPTEKIEIPPPRAALLAACENYMKYVPDGDDFISITYMMANTFYRYNRFEEAVEKFAIIALEHPEHQLAEYSANLILDSYNLLDQPDKVNEWARRFAGNRRLSRGSFGEELAEVIEASALTMVERQAEAGNHVEAAEAYEGFVREFPRSERADAALFNASVSWASARNLDRALEIRARIIRDYPKSELVPDAIFTTASGYESVVDWPQAVEFYEMYFQAFSRQQAAQQRARQQRRRGPPPSESEARYEESKAQEALFQAAILREGLGDYAQSRAHRLRYVDMWPEADDSRALYRSVADLLEKENEPAQAARHLERYVERYGSDLDADQRLLIDYRRLRLFERAGQARMVNQLHEEFRQTFRRLGSDPERLEGGLLPVAIAELLALEPEYQAYTRVRLEYPWRDRMGPAQLTARLQQRPSQQLADRLRNAIDASDAGFRASLERKSGEMQKVVQKYMTIVQYRQGEPALCALERIGDAYHDFLEALRDAPGPPYLRAIYELQIAIQGDTDAPSADEADLDGTFRAGLAEQAFPLEEQAIEAWTAAVDNSRQLGLHTECARRALAKLRAMRPAQFPVIVEEVAEPSVPAMALRHGQPLLTEIQEIPETDESGEGLPPDVASAPRPDGRAAARPTADRRGRSARPASGGGGTLPEPDEDLLR